MPQKTLVIGHRGASAYLPENTLPAFRMAFDRFFADMVELDVRLSKDGIPVICHDPTLKRIAGSSASVSHLNFSQLQELDAAFHFDPGNKGLYPKRGQGIIIPSFEEVLQSFPGRSFAVEIKEKSQKLVHLVVSLLKKYEACQRSVVGSKHAEVSNHLVKNFPHIRRFCSRRDILGILIDYNRRKRPEKRDPNLVAALPLTFFGIHFDDPAFIQYLHRRGIQIFYWTVNDPSVAQALISKDADGIVTDDPAMINQILGRDFGTVLSDD